MTDKQYETSMRLAVNSPGNFIVGMMPLLIND